MKKKSIACILVGALALGNMNLVMAESFEGREDEMNAKCAAVSDTATLNQCKRYKEYLEEKSKNLDSQINDIKNQVSSIQGDVDKIKKAVDENTQTIKSYDTQIASIQANITKIENNIASMNKEIKVKQVEIKERDALMKERMLEIQAYVGSNSYIDFIMGSTGFSDLIRRSEIVSELNSYENDQIKTLSKEKKAIDKQKKIIEQQKEFLEVQKQDIDAKKKIAEALYDSNKKLAEQYQSQQADLNARQIAKEMESQSIKASLPTINTTIPPNFGGNTSGGGSTSGGDTNTGGNNSGDAGSGDQSGGNSGGNSGSGDTSGLSTYLQVPMDRSYWNYYYGTWAYPGGGVHVGMDFSTGLRTRIPVVAPASGIILNSYSGCPEYGGLGNHCGIAWGGNSVLMAVTLANGQSYVLLFFHLYAPSVSPGQIVTQGQQIGLSGSSGNSSGPHLHVEVINMGTQSLQQIVNTWNANKDYIFGLSWFSPDACGTAPCRLRPESFFL